MRRVPVAAASASPIPPPPQTHLSLTSRCADRYATLLASGVIEYGSTAMTCWLGREILRV